ncbi:MAG: hypothetical protein HC915_16550, partial [Anaerolineae bacterium]|nr:hypothetical protein [Anaerolineae bacterium]
VDVLFTTEDELPLASAGKQGMAAYQHLFDLGVSLVVTKQAERGCAIVTSGRHLSAAAYPSAVSDTLGAGDCLARRLRWLALALAAAWLPGARTVDDAFITFRYSRNLVEGAGFVYNPGERVLGTTTPLYASLMAALGGLLGEDYPRYALAVNGLANAGSAALLFLIAWRLSQHLALAVWSGLLWAITPFSVTFAIGGMETSVHSFFMLAAWYAYLLGRPVGVGVACALGVLTRPDALIWAGPLLLHQLWTHWRERPGHPWLARLPWRTWGVGLALYLPWFCFAWAYFGNPLPQTVGAKAVVYQLDDLQAFIRLIQHYATPFHEHLTFGIPGIAVGVFVFPALAVLGIRAGTLLEPRALPMLLYPWLYLVVFAAANPLIFRWYLTPPLPAYF